MYRLSVIGVGNMAKAVIGGIVASEINVNSISLFDKIESQYDDLKNLPFDFSYKNSIGECVANADMILLSVKPQNFKEVLEEIATVDGYEKKLYISIAAGISSEDISDALGGACVIRVLPNLPIVIKRGVSLICKNPKVEKEKFDYVTSLFSAAGSVMVIDEADMNTYISATSSSPAIAFKFINALYKGGVSQGLPEKGLLDAICDAVIGSVMMLKETGEAPEILISRVASKGGTTQKALDKLDELGFDGDIEAAMVACTKRAYELGQENK